MLFNHEGSRVQRVSRRPVRVCDNASGIHRLVCLRPSPCTEDDDRAVHERTVTSLRCVQRADLVTWDRKRLTFRFEELAHGAPWPLTEFSEVSFGDTLGQVKPRLEPVGFFWKNATVGGRAGTNFWTGRTCWYKLYNLFGRAGTSLGRDLV